MNNIEPAKIHIASVQHIKTFRFIGYYIQEVDVMHGSIRKVYKGGNVGLYFEEGMYPYRCFGLCVNFAHQNTLRHKSMVVESIAYTLPCVYTSNSVLPLHRIRALAISI